MATGNAIIVAEVRLKRRTRTFKHEHSLCLNSPGLLRKVTQSLADSSPVCRGFFFRHHTVVPGMHLAFTQPGSFRHHPAPRPPFPAELPFPFALRTPASHWSPRTPPGPFRICIRNLTLIFPKLPYSAALPLAGASGCTELNPEASWTILSLSQMPPPSTSTPTCFTLQSVG